MGILKIQCYVRPSYYLGHDNIISLVYLNWNAEEEDYSKVSCDLKDLSKIKVLEI